MKRNAIPAGMILLVFNSVSFGWGEEGHRIIVRIAEHYLTPTTKAAVADLLGKETPCDVAVWADFIRTQPGYEWTRVFHTASVPDDTSTFDMDRDCAKGCNVAAILRFTDVLEKRTASRKEQTEALKFLLHFVGDLHQPIHVTSRDEDKPRQAKLMFFAEPASLHKIWDTLIIVRAMKTWESHADDLQKKITREQFEKWSANTDPAAWADESHAVTVKYAYDLPEDNQIGQDYCDRCLPALNERLQMGGVRLAARLNAIFDPKPRQPTTATAPASDT